MRGMVPISQPALLCSHLPVFERSREEVLQSAEQKQHLCSITKLVWREAAWQLRGLSRSCRYVGVFFPPVDYKSFSLRFVENTKEKTCCQALWMTQSHLHPRDGSRSSAHRLVWKSVLHLVTSRGLYALHERAIILTFLFPFIVESFG